MTKSEESRRNLEIKQEELGIQREASQRAAKAQLAAAGIKAGGTIAAKLLANDPEWYKRGDNSLARFTGFSNSHPSGYATPVQIPISGGNKFVPLPGVVAYPFLDTFGPQKSGDVYGRESALTLACTLLKDNLRTYNSRMGGYNDIDIIKVLIGQTLMLQMEKHLSVAIQSFYTKSEDNYFLNGRTLITALGFDPVDFKANIVRYRELYEQIHDNNVKKLTVPASLYYSHRKIFMTGAMFKEFDGVHAPIHVFFPHCYPGLGTINNALAFIYCLGGKQKPVTVPLNTDPLQCGSQRIWHYQDIESYAGMTYLRFEERYYAYFEQFVRDYSFNDMMADLRTCFKEDSSRLILPWVDVTKPLEIPVAPQVLLQLRNATVGYLSTNKYYSLFEDTLGTLQAGEYNAAHDTAQTLPLITGNRFTDTKYFLNFHYDEMDGDSFLEMTRLIDLQGNANLKYSICTCSEALMVPMVFAYPVLDSITGILMPEYSVASIDPVTHPYYWLTNQNIGSGLTFEQNWAYYNSNINKGPMFDVISSGTVGNGNYTISVVDVERDYIAFIRQEELGELNSVCFKSLMFVPVLDIAPSSFTKFTGANSIASDKKGGSSKHSKKFKGKK